MPLITNSHQLSVFRLNKTAVPALLIVVIGTAALASAHLIRAAFAKKSPEAAGVAQLVQSRPTLVEIQRITLRSTGFEPAEVTRPAGRFLLAINDRSGQRESGFVLRRSNGEQLREFGLRETSRKHEWREVVNLPPGRYVLSDVTNPERVCQILLTN